MRPLDLPTTTSGSRYDVCGVRFLTYARRTRRRCIWSDSYYAVGFAPSSVTDTVCSQCASRDLVGHERSFVRRAKRSFVFVVAEGCIGSMASTDPGAR